MDNKCEHKWKLLGWTWNGNYFICTKCGCSKTFPSWNTKPKSNDYGIKEDF